jgi:hypothetical protein
MILQVTLWTTCASHGGREFPSPGPCGRPRARTRTLPTTSTDAPSTAGKPASTGARRGGAGGVGTGGRTTDHLGGETRRAADDDAAARRTPKVGSSPSRPRLVPPEVAAGCRGGAAPSERPPVPEPWGALGRRSGRAPRTITPWGPSPSPGAVTHRVVGVVHISPSPERPRRPPGWAICPAVSTGVVPTLCTRPWIVRGAGAGTCGRGVHARWTAGEPRASCGGVPGDERRQPSRRSFPTSRSTRLRGPTMLSAR